MKDEVKEEGGGREGEGRKLTDTSWPLLTFLTFYDLANFTCRFIFKKRKLYNKEGLVNLLIFFSFVLIFFFLLFLYSFTFVLIFLLFLFFCSYFLFSYFSYFLFLLFLFSFSFVLLLLSFVLIFSLVVDDKIFRWRMRLIFFLCFFRF